MELICANPPGKEQKKGGDKGKILQGRKVKYVRVNLSNHITRETHLRQDDPITARHLCLASGEKKTQITPPKKKKRKEKKPPEEGDLYPSQN